jgi:hypothetical protein
VPPFNRLCNTRIAYPLITSHVNAHLPVPMSSRDQANLLWHAVKMVSAHIPGTITQRYTAARYRR